VDAGGLLQIGPESAGSDPGPVAYGRGNDRPTVTDANIVLGRIDPGRPLGEGLGALDLEAAKRAIELHVARPLKLDVMDAAEAIVRIANSAMAGAIRLVSIERGFDPERFVFMPFGGGGALHAGAMISEVGLARALVPRYPGVTSAMGCVIADMRQDFVQTLGTMLDALDLEELRARMQDHLDQGNATLDAADTGFAAREARFELDMAYLGQTHTVAVPVTVEMDGGTVKPLSAGAIRAAFEETYRGLYGRLLNSPMRVLNLRSAVLGKRPKFDLATLAPGPEADIEAAAKGARPVYAQGAWHEARVFDRLALPVGARIDGPAVLEQPDATIFVEPWLVAEVDGHGNVLLTAKESAA
jgi:N-methylhydantoinase A